MEMDRRQQLIAMLQETLDICARETYQVQGETVRHPVPLGERMDVQVFLPEDQKEWKAFSGTRVSGPGKRCLRTCSTLDSFTAARRMAEECDFSADPRREVLVLNFASAVHPGGGVRRGARAQEEALCRESSLLPALESEAAASFYAYNYSIRSFLGSDAVILTPKVEILRDAGGNLLPKPVTVAVLTCAAPNIRHGLEGLSQAEYVELFRNRIRAILRAAASQGYRKLVLGAFGCGAFMNDAALISDLFREELDQFSLDGMEEKDLFDRVEFAVLSRGLESYNYREFARNFGRKDLDPVLFWTVHGPYGEFCNWYPSPFRVDGEDFFCMEQFLMARKAKLFGDRIIQKAIMAEVDPEQCKRLGRRVTPYRDEEWSQARYGVLKEGLLAKFRQNPMLALVLLNTGDRLIAEASPYDRIYGIGMSAEVAAWILPEQWQGRNLLGKALMEVREILRSEDYK